MITLSPLGNCCLAMDWLPAVKPHKLTADRWSGRHSPSLLEDLVSPYLDKDTCVMRAGPQIASHRVDLVYASSDNTLTILHSALVSAVKCEESSKTSDVGPGEARISSVDGQTAHATRETSDLNEHAACVVDQLIDEPPLRSDLAHQVCLLPSVTDIQVFETQLAVSGIYSVGDNLIVHTMYHVFCFSKSDSKYTQHLLYSSQDHVLSVTAQTNGYVHILTVSRLVMCLGTWEGTCRGAEITSQVDVSDIWRVEPLERAMFSIYTSGCFVVLESSAIHFITETQHFTPCTIPTDYLDFTEKFLNFSCGTDSCGTDSLYVVSTNYLLIFSINEGYELTLVRQLSHNVADAHVSHLYPLIEYSLGVDSSQNLMFSVMSNSKCSFFNVKDCPTSPYVTCIVPYKLIKLRSIQVAVLDKVNYLALSVDKRNCITRRLDSGISGAFTDCSNCQFILSEHKDLFYRTNINCDKVYNYKKWNEWLSTMTFDREYWTEPVGVDMFYKKLLGSGLQLTKSTNHKKEYVSRDPLLDNTEDKYTRSLVDAWEWV